MEFTLSQKEEILNLYDKMRVTDVRDGMDWMGFHHYGTMSEKMRPLWPTKAMGFAKTSRYIPYDRPVPQGAVGDKYTEWSNWFYKEVCVYPWMDEAQKYDMFVIDQSNLSVGLMGSMNSLMPLVLKGAIGYVIDGGIRDTDEVIDEQIPVWSKKRIQPMDQARIQYENHNCKINCDGVCVNPGDLVVADGDGVIVVPSDVIYDVAKYAAQEMNNDKPARKWLYLRRGLDFDGSVDVQLSPEMIDKYDKQFGYTDK
ncbi:MAG: RraA family protein [Eubacteriales bacterium]|nr:RraA family protein [Eubacteriales bacterium]